MDVIVVGGPHSGVGKTLAAEIVIRTLAERKVGAVKLTVADGERDVSHDHGPSALALADAAGICGRGMSCGVCETVSAKIPSRLVTSQGAMRKKGTDTCRLHDAGAVAVAWVISLREAAPAALESAIDYLRDRGAQTVVVEGTTALQWLRPMVSVMVAADPGRRWKAVALERVSACDIVLRNFVPMAPGTEPAPPAFAAARPIGCDLSDPNDDGTRDFVRRLARLCDLKSARASSSAGSASVAS